MSRPTTKEDLIRDANQYFDKLWNMIEQMSEDCKNAPFADEMANAGKESHWERDKNVRDVLAHLYEWHHLFLNWVTFNLKGDRQPFLPSPYNWNTYPDLNIIFWEKHQSTSLSVIITKLEESHHAVMKLIDSFSNTQLFAKKAFDWTGTTTLGSYAVSTTFSHYVWGIKKLKKHLKMHQVLSS